MRGITFACLLGLAISGTTFGLNLPEGTALISYYLGDITVSIAVFTGEGLQTVRPVSIPRSQLVEKIEAFREELSSPPAPGEEALRELRARELGKELYDLLVAPIEGYIRDASHLVIVPSGELFYLPFEALFRCPDCEAKRDLWGGSYLIERYSISYLPTLLAPFGEGRRIAYRSLLALSPPQIFLYASKEVEALSSLFPEAQLLSDPLKFKEELMRGKYDVVHIPYGCFRVNPEDPWELSGFSFPEGTLSVADVAEAGVEVDLFVFSGSFCGRPVPGLGAVLEGLLGSGISSLVLPLWAVNDMVTSVLLKEMYRGLFEGLPKGEALRQARLSLLRSDVPFHRHPYFWAGFVLYGDWRGGAAVGTGKVEYGLYRKLIEWRLNPVGEPPLVEVLLTLKRPVAEEDLRLLEELFGELEILGAYGNFIVLRIPITLLDKLIEVPQVYSISEVPETIP